MKRRVLHVIPFLWSGAGRVVSQLALSQSARWDVAMVTSGASRGQQDWPAYRRVLSAAGIRHHQIDFFDRDPAVYWSSVEALARLVDRWRPDVVHTHAGVPVCAAAAVRDIATRRFRLINHMYNWGVGRPAWMNAMDLAGIRRADRIVCSARAYERLLRENGVPSRKIAYVPWGLDLDTIRAQAGIRNRRRSSGPVVGFLGRIEPRKGQLELVRAFARLRRSMPDARLELIGPAGDAGYAVRLVQMARQLDLDDAVVCTGHVRDPYARMARWDLFVSLSSDEGQGLAALEAMALDVPVLARRVAGLEDYLEDGVTGWICPGRSSEAIAGAMRRALGDRRRPAIVRRARHLTEQQYDWNLTVKRLDRVYRTVSTASS